MIGVDSGWEIYVAGNGGIKTEVAQFLVKVKTARRGARVRRRLPAALPRGGLVPRAHRALRRARRPRLREEARARRRRRAAARCGSGCSSRSTASPTRGTSWRRRASTRGSSNRWRCTIARAAPGRDADRDDDDCTSPSARSTTFRALGARVVERPASRRQHRGVPHRRRPRVRAARPLPAQGRAAVAGHRLRRPRRLPAAQLVRSSSPTARPSRPTSAARARFAVNVERRHRVSSRS